MKKAIAILLAAGVMFFWGFLSWGILPWHYSDWKKFTDEPAVIAALKAQAPEAGIYSIPWMNPPRDRKLLEKASADGPWFVGVVRPGSNPVSMGSLMAKNFLSNIVIAAILGFILSHAAALSYGRRLALGAAVGLVAGLLGNAANHIWFETPLIISAKLLLDNVVSCVLASAVIGAFMCKT